MDGWLSGFADVAQAVRDLAQKGFMPPYYVVAGVGVYAQWHRLYGKSGVLEAEQVQKLVGGGIFQSPLVPDGVALVGLWLPKKCPGLGS